MNRHALALALLIAAAITVPVVACLWDYDTLEMERQRFPDTLELITGKFLRHSNAFYAWRIEDREKRLTSEPSMAALYDDLAVAYEKTGDHARAIAIMLQQKTRFAGRYETHANLGTFYIDAIRADEAAWIAEGRNPEEAFASTYYDTPLVSTTADGPRRRTWIWLLAVFGVVVIGLVWMKRRP